MVEMGMRMFYIGTCVEIKSIYSLIKHYFSSVCCNFVFE